MAIWHCDNFSTYGLAFDDIENGLDGVYAQISRGGLGNYLGLQVDPDGISGGRVLWLAGNNNQHPTIRCVNPGGSQTAMGTAFRVWLTSLPGLDEYDVTMCEFLNNAATSMFRLSVSNTGRLRVATTASSFITDIPAITANGWYHIECFCDQTNLEVRVEGVPVIGPSAHGMSVPGYAQWRARSDDIGTSADDPNMYIKDLVCYDDQGSYNNNFIGSVLVTNQTILSDVSLNWTPSTGSTGYQILDNIPPNDTQYISAEDDPLPSPYVGQLSSLPDEVTSVKAVMTYVRAAKSDGGDGSLQVGVISDPDGTPATALGADRPITVAQTYWRDVFEEDPVTNAPWLPAAVNEAQIQIDRTT